MLRNETTSKLQARRDVKSLQILVPEQLESLFWEGKTIRVELAPGLPCKPSELKEKLPP